MNYKNSLDFVKNESIRKTKSVKRTLVKNSAVLPANALSGKVVEVGTKLYVVEYLNESKIRVELNCFVGGSLVSPHKNGSLICCGDNVKFIVYESNDENSRAGTILEVEHRDTKLSRIDPANNNREHVVASNMNQLLICMSVFDPILNFRLIDRLLVASMLGNMKPAICINKIELADMESIDSLFDPYREMKIPIYFLSMSEGLGLDKLFENLAGNDTVMVGMSGVGKSTLLNKIFGRKVQKVLEVSESSGKGRHTTSFIRRFELPFGGHLTDTPGVREFGLWDLSEDELGVFFPDFYDFYPNCKFLSCTHTHEPGCKVKEAAENGSISSERYNSYLNILESLKE